MSRKSGHRFCDNDMRQNKDLKRMSESERSRHALARRNDSTALPTPAQISRSQTNTAPEQQARA
ncbi:hypothetical protein DC415_00795 [Agrobacterium tumefaciens]|uniref:Uncharacterized protein n=1 Tax=Rhizobium rhizogenes TaxID=359 RepID=A0AA92C766_RHIRH|nr:hypothetical protein DC430_05420 [Rhizobium rhizogenes]PVE68320.1 hypothetical protein DC415_00795 [Agrobacterium tumefaciens]PVE78068.1 hypothetical protein DCP16_00795 [Sphingomonas sp. TPD3009]